MVARSELTDALIALIPEDGSRITNEQIRAALEKEAGEPISNEELKEIKALLVAMDAAQSVKGLGGPKRLRESLVASFYLLVAAVAVHHNAVLVSFDAAHPTKARSRTVSRVTGCGRRPFSYTVCRQESAVTPGLGRTTVR